MLNGSIIYFIFGSNIILIGLIFLWVIWLVNRKTGKLEKTRTYSAAELKQLHANAVYKSTSGTVLDLCEIKGVAETEIPLIAPVSNTPCIAYDYKIERLYEGSAGLTKSQIVHHDKKFIPFWLRDQSGRIKVYPQEADIDFAETAYFDVSPNVYNPNLSAIPPSDTNQYRHFEQCIPLNARLYILGTLLDFEGEAAVAHHTGKTERFFITLRQEEAVVKSTKDALIWLYLFCGGAFFIGVCLIILGLQ